MDPERCSEPLTFPYKAVDSQQSYIDVFLPTDRTSGKHLRTILYFHGGGLTVGSRKSWFPQWIHDRALQAGYAFITADYKLLPPATAHDVVQDIRDLFHFLDKSLNEQLNSAGRADTQVDASSVIVSGSSAGGLCAYLAALHAVPKPKGVLSLYGMGGNLLSPQYLTVKTEPFFMGREMLDPNEFRQFLIPFPPDLQTISDSPLVYHSLDHPTTPGWPANPRMQLCRLYLQLGNFLDYYTGEHIPSLSTRLRAILESKGGDLDAAVAASHDVIPQKHIGLFPQFLIDSNFPPTFLFHGGKDSAVRVQESLHLKKLLDAAGVDAILRVADGQEHSFDYSKGASERFAATFDEAFIFMSKVFNGDKQRTDMNIDRHT
ncbi:hypothetical protein M0805_005913 [Coniferiporia weirii]|nr:hypothetical protein M0805_005913 [Coniferiporia weirii]